MTLRELLSSLSRNAAATAAGAGSTHAAEALDRPVRSLAYDSRRVVPGSVFVGLKGHVADGTAFVEQALSRGAVAVVSESAPPAAVPVPWVVVEDARMALAELSAAFFRSPSHEMRVVGITGTNGKTTTAYLLSGVLEAAGIGTGLIGTVAYRIGGVDHDAGRTTPESSEVQQFLREMVDQGSGACVMEVSSHALSLRRVDATRFAVAVFTNLTRDHLDFHGDMESYFQAKRRLFEMLPPDGVAVVNGDDPRGESLLRAAPRSLSYAVDRHADVRPGPLSCSLQGLAFDVRTPRGTLAVRSKLVGRPNVYNILAATTAALALDVPIGAIEEGLSAIDGVPGRFQIVSAPGDDITVVVDYAHTDDALKNLLETARPLAPQRLITVFGCGGDRDRTKRPLMGAVAARLSDLVVITSDNPRSEDPSRIIEEIKRGVVPPPDRTRPAGRTPHRVPSCLTVVDRRAAIRRAIEGAQPGDVVLIAGKGHEKYQVVGDRTLPFDDVEVARAALGQRRTDAGAA
jgi:UDP-N-acetylmuramoyl-L-alanyl-D-glutamate--2,6-diaminopimelate ligase